LVAEARTLREVAKPIAGSPRYERTVAVLPEGAFTRALSEQAFGVAGSVRPR
jgi:hypothetical protein